MLVRPAFGNCRPLRQRGNPDKEDLSLAEEIRLGDSRLDILHPMGPDGMDPQVLRELAAVIVRPHLMNFGSHFQLPEGQEGDQEQSAWRCEGKKSCFTSLTSS